MDSSFSTISFSAQCGGIRFPDSQFSNVRIGAAMYHLKQYLDSRTDNNPALFVSLKAPHQRLGKAGAESMIRKIGIAAGIHAHPHKFRRSWITDNHAKGMDIAYIQEYAGHVKLETTRLYITIDESAVRNAYFRYAS